MDLFVIALAASVLVGNVVATVAIIRSSPPSRKKQMLQLGIVWIVPILGAILIGMFYYSIGRSGANAATSMGNEQDYPGVNLYPPHGPSDE